MKIKIKDKNRVFIGGILFIIGVLMLSHGQGIPLDKLFLWILNWSFISLGLYTLLLGLFWIDFKEILSITKITRKFFRFILLIISLSIFVTIYIKGLNLNHQDSFLLGFGFGLLFGTFTFTIYQKIDSWKKGSSLK